MAGFVERTSARRNWVSDTIKQLSSFGMKYDDMVLKNSKAIGVTEDQFGYTYDPMGLQGGDYDEYRLFANLAAVDISSRKNACIFDKKYPQKRVDLRKFALEDEIEEVLDKLADETIVYDPKNYFCHPLLFDTDLLKEDVVKRIQDSINEYFKKIYLYFQFNNEGVAWSYFRKWLVDGYLAFEIIYSDDKKHIIGFKELDPVTLEPGLDKEGKKIWKQFPKQPGKERVLMDAEILYISYTTVNSPTRESYVERLIRSFNLLRIMEHSRIIWAVVNASFKTKFIIPVGGKSKNRAKQSLGILMQQYRENVDFNTESGELKINGKPMMPFNKEYWLPENEAGTPQIETIGGDGPDLSDTESVKYFREKFIRVSKIPFSRFDMESPPSWEMDATSITRDEIRFGRFVNRLRSIFSEIITKPLWLQLAIEYPELRDDDFFKAQIGIGYNKYNVFEEMKEMELLQKQVDFITSMKDALVETDANMNEVHFFSSEFLVRKFMKQLSEDDLKLNRRLKEKEDEEKKKSAEEASKAMGMG